MTNATLGRDPCWPAAEMPANAWIWWEADGLLAFVQARLSRRAGNRAPGTELAVGPALEGAEGPGMIAVDRSAERAAVLVLVAGALVKPVDGRGCSGNSAPGRCGEPEGRAVEMLVPFCDHLDDGRPRPCSVPNWLIFSTRRPTNVHPHCGTDRTPTTSQRHRAPADEKFVPVANSELLLFTWLTPGADRVRLKTQAPSKRQIADTPLVETHPDLRIGGGVEDGRVFAHRYCLRHRSWLQDGLTTATWFSTHDAAVHIGAETGELELLSS